RDHLIVVRTPEPYRVPLERTAAELGVPLHCFCDQGVGEHPLGRRWLAVADLVAGGAWLPEAVLGVLASAVGHGAAADAVRDGVAGAYGRLATYLSQLPTLTTAVQWGALAEEGSEAFERARLAGVWLGQDSDDLSTVGSPLPVLLRRLVADHRAFQAIKGEGPDALQARLDLLVELLGRWVVQPWRTHAWRWAARLPVKEHALAVNCLLQVGADLRSIAGSAAAGLAARMSNTSDHGVRAVELLRMALAKTPVPDPEGRRDVVHVMSVLDARTMEADHVYVLGLLAGEFPRRPAPSLVLDEAIRAELNGRQRRAYEESRGREWERPEWRLEAHALAYEAWLFQVACTRARKGLVLSAPQLDGAQELVVSHWFEGLLALAPPADAPVADKDHLSQLLPRLEEWVDARDAAGWLACHTVSGGDSRSGSRQALAQLGLHRSLKQPAAAVWLATQVAALQLDGGASLGAQVDGLAARIPAAPRILRPGYPADLLAKPSVTRLNTLAQCPFKFFAQVGCRLDAQPHPHEAGIPRMDQGLILHRALELWVLEGRPEVSAAELLARVLAEPTFARRFSTVPPLGELHRRALERTLEGFLAHERSMPVPWTVEGSEPERRFGFRDTPQVELPLDRDPTLTVRGAIDRLDRVHFEGREWSVIYDYKDSRKSLKDHELTVQGEAGPEAGEADDSMPVTLLEADLQLPLYCWIAEQLTGRPTLAAFQYPLREPEKVRHGFLLGDATWEVRLAFDKRSGFKVAAPTDDHRRALYGQVFDRIRHLLGAFDGGRIAPEPLVGKRCGPGRCNYAELCRYEEYPPRESW
ncbi:MAG TPA: PD-(D/E)XK nuclease family protein, partial [bacterium]|nr:PD-(D/E)XK nuclease family protein [bacterium]